MSRIYLNTKTSNVFGVTSRTYKDEHGQTYVALCDVLTATEHDNVTSFAKALTRRANARVVRPVGDAHRKWVALLPEVKLHISKQRNAGTINDPVPDMGFTDAEKNTSKENWKALHLIYKNVLRNMTVT